MQCRREFLLLFLLAIENTLREGEEKAIRAPEKRRHG